MLKVIQNYIDLPLFAVKVSAGFPSPADDYLEDEIDLVSHLVRRPAATFVMQVVGKIMNRFRSIRSLQKFIHLQSTFQNHFNQQRHLEKRNTFKNLRQTSVDVWNEILVA